MKRLILVLILSTLPVAARAQTAADSAAIRQTALDYIEGWYEGNAERMERALHPGLAKRIMTTRGPESRLESMTAGELVNGTRSGGGRRTPTARRQKEVRILDVFGNVASVRVTASDWIDYMHMAKSDGKWVIVNVLWEMKPRA